MPVPILGGILDGGVAAALYRDRFGAISFPLRGGVRPFLVFPFVLGARPLGFTLRELQRPTVNFRLA